MPFQLGNDVNSLRRVHGGGRPSDTYKLRDLIDATVSEHDWAEIIAAQVCRAKAGEHKSADFLTRYRFGLPRQEVDLLGVIAVIATEMGLDEGARSAALAEGQRLVLGRGSEPESVIDGKAKELVSDEPS